MKRFFRKKLRQASKVKVKPKKLGIISIFAFAIFTVAMMRVFATTDVTFELVPNSQVYDRDENYEVTMDVKFDTNKTWDKIAVTIYADPNVFENVSLNFTNSGLAHYDKTALSRTEKTLFGTSNFSIITVADPSHPEYISSTLNFVAQEGQTLDYNQGLYLGTLTAEVKADAPGGYTTVSVRIDPISGEEGDTPATYLMNGDNYYDVDSIDATVLIDVPVDTHGIDKNSLSLDINKNPTDTINVVYSPLDTTTPKNISYSSSNTAVCTVSQEGLVTAVSSGNCNITVNEFGDTHTVPVTVTAELISINLDEDLVQINKTGTHQFVVTNNPNPTTDNVTYNWSVADQSVATISNTGLVTGVGGGTTTITCTAVINGTTSTITKSATVKVVVPFTGASANPSTINLTRGVQGQESQTINVVFTPSDATQDPIVTWSSSDPTTVTVDENGVVTGLKTGSATITGQVSGISDFYVTVNVSVPILSFEVTPSTVELYPGQDQTLTPAITPSDTDENTNITWSSSTPGVATVTNGVVHAVAAGTTTITAATGNSNGKTDTVEVTVVPTITGVTLSSTSFTLYTNNGTSNKTKTLTATINPTGAGTAADRVITWNTSDPSIATVSGGVVTAVGNGVATITATTGDNQSASATVTVKTKVTSFTLTNSNSVTLEIGSTHQINTSIAPENASDKTITWTPGNTSVATVSSTGLVTAVGNGTTTITGVCDGKQVVVTVKVVTSATAIEITDGDITVNKGTVRTLQTQITPATSTDTKVWSTSDSTTVSVNPTTGEITALKAGTATITVTAGSVHDDITVTVIVPATGIVITESDNITLNKGSEKTLSKTVTPNDCTETVTWSSGDSSKVSVNQNGKITAVAITSTPVAITATVGSYSDTVYVTVILAATAVDIDQGSSINIEKGSTTTLTATITPSGSTDGIVWSSNHSNIASVDSSTGVVTGVATGTATITATVGNVQDTITVKVVISATGITINGTKPRSINKDEEITLTTTVTPNNSTDTVTWTSSNNSVATVTSAGKVTGIAKGTATITATAGSQSDTITINVLLPATSVTISGSESFSMNKGTTKSLSATVAPTGSTDTVTWSTSDSTKVSVNSSTGQISAVAVGTATITATAGSKSDTVTVTVLSPATSVTINQGSTISVNKGSTRTLTATVDPSDSTDTVTWSSNKTNVATVSASGVVTGVAPGTATITATAGSKTATITVTVLSPASSVSIDQGNSVSVNKGSTTDLTATVSPSDSTDTVTWSSSNTSIATVNSTTGRVTGVAKGSATITATAGSKSDTITVNVLVPATSISINGSSSITIARGTTRTLTASVLPSDTTDTVTWSSNKTNVATVSASGVVTGVAKGTATITATAGSKTSTVTVTVNAPITSFTTTTPNVTVIKGRTATLTYTIEPSDTTDSKTVTWVSSDTSKVTVDEDGVITGIASGSATVTATVAGHSIEYSITVGIIPVTAITLNKHNFQLKKGNTENLTYTVEPDDSTEITDPVWTSSNPNVATVDQNGKVTAISGGNSTITVTMNGTIVDNATVTVFEIPLTNIEISNGEQNVTVGESITIHVTQTPSDTTDVVTYSYTSSDPTVATVDENGNVTAIGDGVVTITVQSSNGLEDSIQLNIVANNPIINPNTGVKSVIIFIITALGSVLGIRFVAKKRFN